MSIFTGRELEFLAGLNRSWWTLYWRELARLCSNKDAAPGGEQDVHPADAGAVLHRRVELAVANR